MAEEIQQSIMRQYDRSFDLYHGLATKAQHLIEEMLAGQGIRVHSVTSRVKERGSLRQKIDNPDKNYAALSDLTDIAGVRIITYFEDDVDKVSKCLEEEFTIDWANTTDKRGALDPDRFGYLTMQHIAQLGTNRAELFEYARFEGLKFEVQTRSILQHAWAEMEHDLGYKSAVSVPSEARRRFSRLAEVLEIADDEFRRLREDLEAYRRDVPDRIKKDPQQVDIDKDSLLAFITESSVVGDLDKAIARITGTGLDEDRPAGSINDPIVATLNNLGIRTIRELANLLSSEQRDLQTFVSEYWSLYESERTNPGGDFSQGITIFYFALFYAGRTIDPHSLTDFLNTSWTRGQRADADRLARRIIGAHRAVDTPAR